jgi:3-phenylpropionate/trans-cinnamate dioxygenase ferredoxin reductase subunit
VAAYGRIAVVGASLAGLRTAEALRSRGHDGDLVILGGEPHMPYDRPPLSKQVLTGKVGPDATALPVADDLGADWRLGQRATGVDLERGVVAVSGGDDIGFDGLVIATGSAARRLPGLPDLDGVFVLRTRDDAAALLAALEAGPRVVVIGAGFIGLEVASSSRARGLDVTVLESADAPLVGAVGARLGSVVADLHRAHGVDVRLGVRVEGLVGGGTDGTGRVEGVRLAGGEVVAADVVVVGVGAAPATDWLAGSGIDVDDGVVADERLRVRAGGRVLPHVVAAGDVARWRHAGWAEAGWAADARVEHWSNAGEQAGAAAAGLLLGDEAEAFTPVPYFWSDQYDRKLQMVGRAAPDDEVAVVDGELGDGKFVVAYGRAGRLVAALGFSRPAKVMGLGRQIAASAAFPPES